jgi:L-asparagine oxygenase
VISREPFYNAAALAEDGFVFLSDFLPGCTTQEAAAQLGSIIDMAPLLPGYNTVQDLRPVHVGSAPKNHYSGNFGLDPFPLHTDFAHWAVPPRFVLLRCVSGTDSVATHLLAWKELLSAISRCTIAKSVFRSRKRRNGNSSLLRALSRRGCVDLFRWDSLFLTPVNRSAEELSDLMRDCTWGAKASKVILIRPNDSILIDNWQILHGRGSVEGHQMHRHLQRAYMMEVFGDGSSR